MYFRMSSGEFLHYFKGMFFVSTMYIRRGLLLYKQHEQRHSNQGPVVQSVVSLTFSLRVISLTVLADSIYNILIFFAEKM